MSVSILLVDDDREAVSSLASLLKQVGCQVSSTLDPRLALAVARNCKPEIAFIGLRMSRMTGSYLAAMLREEKALDECALVALSKAGSGHGWLSVRAVEVFAG